MKLEINLDDIFADEGVTLQEAVQREAVQQITTMVKKGITQRINEETERMLNEQLQAVIQEQMPTLINDVFNTEYTPTDDYGRRGKPTTFRGQLIKAVSEQCVYKKERSSYGASENAFTKAVDSVIEEQLKAFRKEFDALIDANFKQSALTYAVNALQSKLGLNKEG